MTVRIADYLDVEFGSKFPKRAPWIRRTKAVCTFQVFFAQPITVNLKRGLSLLGSSEDFTGACVYISVPFRVGAAKYVRVGNECKQFGFHHLAQVLSVGLQMLITVQFCKRT